jgi:hypothetical protein
MMFWKKAKNENISFPNYFYFDMCVWVNQSNMTDKEKKDNPLYWITDGYLKIYEYKQARRIAFWKASKEEIQQTIELPNFEYGIFEEITWISKEDIQKKI